MKASNSNTITSQDTGAGTKLENFSPPNLVHSTSAAFVNVSALPSFSSDKRNDHDQQSAVILLLLPSPLMGLLPSMRPRYLGEGHNNEEAEHSRIGIPHTDYFGDEFPWSSEVLLRVLKGLFASASRSVDEGVDRELEGLFRSTSGGEMKTAGLKKGNGWQRSREIGEGGMYI